MRLLSPTTLLARLDPVLPLLSHGARDLPERQRTMHSAIQWSYDLLSPPQQAVFRRLAVFRGGWTLEGAESVATGDGVLRDDVLDLLSDLNEQSLIAVEPGGSTRVRMLEPIRQFALGLLETTDEAESVRDRHADFYAELAAEAEAGMRGREQVAWLARLDEEHDNVRAALDWLVRQRDLARASRFAFSLWLFWWMRGHFSEGRRWIERILAADPAPADRAWVLLVSGVLDYGQGSYEPAGLANDESLALFGASGDELRHGVGHRDGWADRAGSRAVRRCRRAPGSGNRALPARWGQVVGRHAALVRGGDAAQARRLAPCRATD